MADVASEVSVIIPCYGQAQFLAEAIESALAQTRPVEIVVVDDGSPDETAEVAARYPAVRCVRQENKGIAEARNTGFRASRGEYLIFLDADDRLTPQAVEAHLRCFAEHPEARFVVGDIDHVAEDGSYIYSPRWPILRSNFYEELLRANHIANTIAVMFRREVVETVGGFEKRFSPAEDYRFLLRAAAALSSAHHRTLVALYRRHGKNTSRKGAVMLRVMQQVMAAEAPRVRGNRRLEVARREGGRYWRDHFARAAIKELYRQVLRGQLLAAFKTLGALLWYVRGRVLFVPWKYRKRLAERIRLRLRPGRNKSVAVTRNSRPAS